MRLFRALFGLLVGSQLAYARVSPRMRPMATQAIVGLMLATSAAEAGVERGGRRAGALLGSAAGIGFAAEQLGVRTGLPFGPYRYLDGLGPKIRGVPVIAAAAWAMMARPAWVTAGMIDSRPSHRVPLAAGALTAWDVYLDPRMVRDGHWRWERSGSFEGVPASNFGGWLATSLVVFSIWARMDRRAERATEGRGALHLYVWTWLAEGVANAAVWRRPRVAVAGATAMGAFAVPALFRSRARR